MVILRQIRNAVALLVLVPLCFTLVPLVDWIADKLDPPTKKWPPE